MNIKQAEGILAGKPFDGLKMEAGDAFLFSEMIRRLDRLDKKIRGKKSGNHNELGAGLTTLRVGENLALKKAKNP